MKTCSIEECGGKLHARGYCGKHYLRWLKHGSPLATLAHRDSEQSFLAHTEPLVWSTCVVWTSTIGKSGYGQISVGGRKIPAHRFAWERERGPIPDGMVIDHICWERSCVNVEHLRLATPAQNMQNQSGAHRGRKHDLPRGVYPHGRGYRAVVVANGTRHHLGSFGTVEEASAAAETKRRVLFGDFAGGA